MTSGVGGSSIEAELAALTRWADRAPPITRDERMARLVRAQALTALAGAQALLVRGGASLRYFTGVTWGQSERLVAMILPTRGEPLMICPAFEAGTLEASMKIEAAARYW